MHTAAEGEGSDWAARGGQRSGSTLGKGFVLSQAEGIDKQQSAQWTRANAACLPSWTLARWRGAALGVTGCHRPATQAQRARRPAGRPRAHLHAGIGAGLQGCLVALTDVDHCRGQRDILEMADAGIN